MENSAHGKPWNYTSVKISDSHFLNNFIIKAAQKYKLISLIF